MKGILMFDNLNDLTFFKADEVLTQHLHNLAVKDGLFEGTSANADKKENVDKNIIVQLFSPLIASYKVMQAQFGNRYKSIESEDGILIVFKEILNYIVIGVSSLDEDPTIIHQHVNVFAVFVKLLYGPSLHIMNEVLTATYNGFTRQELLVQLMDKWSLLRKEQQMFLVEAVERLLINQDITATCVDLLQEALQKVRAFHREGIFSHCFLLVDTKLLALYSSRNSSQLPKEDLLLLILVAEVLKHHNKNPKENAEKDELDGMQSLLVFLKSQFGIVVPHIVYTIGITQRITLIILCEMAGKGTLSSCMAVLVDVLYNLQNHPLSRLPLYTFESIETVYKNILETARKLKVPGAKERYLRQLAIKWEQMRQCGIAEYLQSTEEESVNPRLDSAISAMCEALKIAFGEIITRPELTWEESTREPKHEHIFLAIQKMAQKRLKDCVQYLEVKAEQNITMASYMAEFPGLIHFIYVDRSSDCLIAPTVVLKEGHLNGTASLRNKIWKMVIFGRRYVDGAKRLYCAWKEEDLRFFYTIWFEDSTGRAIKPTEYPDLQKFPTKGILCGNFFKQLTEKCFPGASYDHICCYELFCVHLESTSAADVVEHSRRLSSVLWEFSGAYRTSLDLL